MAGETPPLRVEEIPGRGRSLVSTRPLHGGEVILRDAPILLYTAIPFSSPSSPYCENCFRKLDQNAAAVTCRTCSSSWFCSPSCLSSPSHSPWVCLALSKLRSLSNGLSADLQLQSRFLVAAYNLSATSPSAFRLLLSLQGDGFVTDEVLFLHSVVAPVEPGARPEMTAALLAKDRLNAFGLMEPFDEGSRGRRSVRAYGIYPRASFFNHDCLPNACRFDYVDRDGEGNTDIVVRMIHDVPVGREVCLSYFPVNLGFAERQGRLMEDYGFRCGCDRCQVESNWSDHEGEDGGGSGGDGNEAMEEEEDDEDDDDDGGEAMEAGSGGDDAGDAGDFPHAYFFMKFVCNREHCWGTLAPLPGPAQSDLLECNVCGNVKKDEVV